MFIHNVGYHHCHDTDFYIDRPEGSGDYLLLLLKSDSIFTLDGEDVLVPKNSFFLYRIGTPQYYRCVPQTLFSNDWIHFLFDECEEQTFLGYQIPYDTPIPIGNPLFLSFCIKAIANEFYSQNRFRDQSIYAYMLLIFAKVSETMNPIQETVSDSRHEMLLTIRNKIYTKPYEQRTVEGAAHEIRMSPSAFQHLYKRYFGVSFTQDLIDSRIAYAKMLLSTMNATVQETAMHCGYQSYAHFARQFKQRTGMTPLEYKSRNCNISS